MTSDCILTSSEVLTTLQQATTWLSRHQDPHGELLDPYFGEPTQYGTAYFAYCCAALADRSTDPDLADEMYGRAEHAAAAALAYISRTGLIETGTGFTRDTGTISRVSHRDFCWPAVLRTYDLLAKNGRGNRIADLIEKVDPLASFDSRPPSNWAGVWISGEWLRIRAGLSKYTAEDIDAWLSPFFETDAILDNGFYLEPGYPNSYDLFLRLHLATLIAEGYNGQWANAIRDLVRTSVTRSLAMQLSDGSLASAARSTGQTWTLGSQAVFFQIAAEHVLDDPQLADRARAAASRAWQATARWIRADGEISPVENCLPASYRVGYEGYTADAHYSSLALAFWETAIEYGFDGRDTPSLDQATAWHEHFPTYRAIAHRGTISAHINADPARKYDVFGLADITFGLGRRLHFATPTEHLQSGKLFTVGMGIRTESGRSPVRAVAHDQFSIRRLDSDHETSSLQLTARAKGSSYLSNSTGRDTYASSSMPGLTDDTYEYRCVAEVHENHLSIEEATPYTHGYKTLLVPYIVNSGNGQITTVSSTGSKVIFESGDECIELSVDARIDPVLVMDYGFENRRGLAGLVRIDLTEPTTTIRYRFSVVR